MRLWSLHPRYLDRQGLTACWREALLAQAVLVKGAGGYAHHPQLERFRAQSHPLHAVGGYLAAVADEAQRRGYRFDRGRIRHPLIDGGMAAERIPVTTGQLALEWDHLRAKLRARSPQAYADLPDLDVPAPHPLFVAVPGLVEEWERAPHPTPEGSRYD